MAGGKIELSDLTDVKNGPAVDIADIAELADPAYELVKEDVEEFLKRPRGPQRRAPRTVTFQSIPATALKSSIDALLKRRNVQQERAKKQMQFDFDSKMRRINRIKSKGFRRMRRRERLRREQEVQEHASESGEGLGGCAPDELGGADPASSDSDSGSSAAPIAEARPGDFADAESSDGPLDDAQLGLVGAAFQQAEIVGNEKEFLEEKMRVVMDDAPQTKETVLPGWDDWAGEGIEVRKTRHNTVVERRDGIRPSDRRDFGRDHVIINEHTEVPEKYRSVLPYGYSAADYERKMRTPISIEANSARVFRRFVGCSNKDTGVLGKNVEPNVFEPDD